MDWAEQYTNLSAQVQDMNCRSLQPFYVSGMIN